MILTYFSASRKNGEKIKLPRPFQQISGTCLSPIFPHDNNIVRTYWKQNHIIRITSIKIMCVNHNGSFGWLPYFLIYDISVEYYVHYLHVFIHTFIKNIHRKTEHYSKKISKFIPNRDSQVCRLPPILSHHCERRYYLKFKNWCWDNQLLTFIFKKILFFVLLSINWYEKYYNHN